MYRIIITPIKNKNKVNDFFKKYEMLVENFEIQIYKNDEEYLAYGTNTNQKQTNEIMNHLSQLELSIFNNINEAMDIGFQLKICEVN